MLSNTGINKILLLGQITTETISNKTVNNQGYLCATIVTNEIIKRGTINVDHAEYHKLCIPEKLVANLQLEAGQTVFVEGKIQTTSYMDEQRIKRYNLEIIASKVEVLGLVPMAV